MNRFPISQRLLARCFGASGSVVISGDTGSICCAHKPFCSPLAQFSTWRERMVPYPMCLHVPNEPIGGSVGSNVLLAMLVSLPLHQLPVTIHGLPVSFAQVFGFDVVMAA